MPCMRVCAWHIGRVGGARAALSWLQWRWLRRRSHTSNCSGRRRKCIHTTSSCRAICVPGCGRSRRTCVGADVALVRAPVVNAAVVACVSVVVASARAPVIIVAVVVTGLAVAVVASVAAAHAVALAVPVVAVVSAAVADACVCVCLASSIARTYVVAGLVGGTVLVVAGATDAALSLVRTVVVCGGQPLLSSEQLAVRS